MGLVLLMFVILVAVFTLLVYLTNRWAAGYISRILEARIAAIQQIVNDEIVPVSWMEPYQARIAKLEQKGAPAAKIERVKRQAQKRCLKQMEELLAYVENVNYEDGELTKKTLVTSLTEQKVRWATPAWEELMQTDYSAIEREFVPEACLSSQETAQQQE